MKSYRKILAHNWLLTTKKKNNDLGNFVLLFYIFAWYAVKNFPHNDEHKTVNRKEISKEKVLCHQCLRLLISFAFFRVFKSSQWISVEACVSRRLRTSSSDFSSENLIILKTIRRRPQRIIFAGDRNVSQAASYFWLYNKDISVINFNLVLRLEFSLILYSAVCIQFSVYEF